MKNFEFDDYLNNQAPLFLEEVFNQSLEMIELMLNNGGEQHINEISRLMEDFKKDFNTHKNVLSPRIHDRIKNINGKISKYNDSIKSQENNLE